MTEMSSGANGGKIKKEEEPASFFAGSAFDSLDILATIATQELNINKNSSENGESNEENEEIGEDGKIYTRGSVQPKKLAEMDVVNMEQVKSMSANTLVRIFAETDFDEMRRMYCYSCYLMPGECKAQFKSFGNESKAKKDIRVHLEKHVDQLVAKQRLDFTAEPIMARKRRIKDLTSYVTTRSQLPARRRGLMIKEEEEGLEKENWENMAGRRKKEDAVPLLAEMTNDQELKRYRLKAEGLDDVEGEEEDEVEEVEAVVEEMAEEQNGRLEELRPAEVKTERVERREQRRSGEVDGATDSGKTVHIAIDEDHCYAFQPGRVKAEYWPEYDLYNTATTTFTATQEEEDDTYSALKGSPPQDMASVEAIQACPVIMEEELPYQEEGKTLQLLPDAEYVKEYVIEPEATGYMSPAVEEEPRTVSCPEFIYQDNVGAEQFYTETIVTDLVSGHPAETDYYGGAGQAGRQVGEADKPAVRIKNKRTVAAVSSEDKRRALTSMEELRARGATTDDLMCRLCDPARPFTAYSTLLTHYRSHAGLRPFECSLCGATFTRQHSLNYHLMTHANQTRFTCPHCNRKFRHPTHFKEHVKKHGEVVQFLCNFCPASLSTQSQYRKHLKMRHNKTIDIMGNIIDSIPEVKDKERAKRKRRPVKPEEEGRPAGGRAKRRRRAKPDPTEISQYEEVVHSSSVDHNSTTVIYEETVPMTESEQMYQTSEHLHPKEVLQMFDPSQGQYVHQLQQYGDPEPRYVEQYVVSAPAQAVRQPQQKAVLAHSEAAPQKSPMIFVVPNGGQKAEAGRQPLLVNSGEQKNPIVISKFQSTGGLRPVADNRIKQGVIAQINGQKVLLVPKKKDLDHVQVVAMKSVPPLVAQAGGDLETYAAVNSVQNVESQGGKQSILEQAMHEVFPVDIDFNETSDQSFTEISPEVGDDLYNPMRSPLKNRNKILCEVLGIDA